MSVPSLLGNASMPLAALQQCDRKHACRLTRRVPSTFREVSPALQGESITVWKDYMRHEDAMDLRSLQKPLKDGYRSDPNSSRITLSAKGGQTNVPVSCSVDIGRAVYQAEAHKGVGGAGGGACSGDLLLGALAACAQITCQMVAAAMCIATEEIKVAVEGDLDLRGTLGISKEAPVGFESIRLRFDVVAPSATAEQLRALHEKTEQYCVVLQTLMHPPKLQTEWVGHS
jgi:uncharacterized OsmC-like protein